MKKYQTLLVNIWKEFNIYQVLRNISKVCLIFHEIKKLIDLKKDIWHVWEVCEQLTIHMFWKNLFVR